MTEVIMPSVATTADLELSIKPYVSKFELTGKEMKLLRTLSHKFIKQLPIVIEDGTLYIKTLDVSRIALVSLVMNIDSLKLDEKARFLWNVYSSIKMPKLSDEFTISIPSKDKLLLETKNKSLNFEVLESEPEKVRMPQLPLYTRMTITVKQFDEMVKDCFESGSIKLSGDDQGFTASADNYLCDVKINIPDKKFEYPGQCLYSTDYLKDFTNILKSGGAKYFKEVNLRWATKMPLEITAHNMDNTATIKFLIAPRIPDEE